MASSKSKMEQQRKAHPRDERAWLADVVIAWNREIQRRSLMELPPT
jgi:hypothetical protein